MIIVDLVAGKIGELLVQEAKLLYGVEDQVRSLQEELVMMNGFLKDLDAWDEDGADERRRATIKQIRRIAYDAEDVIESYIFKASSSTNNNKHAACFCFSLSRTHQVGSQIESIKARIAETTERLKKYVDGNGVSRGDGAGLSRGRRRRQIAYPHTHEEHVVGLDEDINKLLRVLMSSDGVQFQVLSILGMGGSGKTTLARKLYNHESVKKHFDCVAWISVSQEWVADEVLLELLRKASGEDMGKDEARSLQILVEKLHQYLEGKTYLIVLDDVWEKEALQQMLPTLHPVNDGRKIIITTRKREVIDFSDLKCSIHEPRRLTEEESWELFRKTALVHREQCNNSVEISVLETLGKEMLKKCQGLPLAVIALSGILCKKETLGEWEKVEKVVSSKIVEEGEGTHLYGAVKEMLGLSYNDLPRELKTCFLYLAMFPVDREIRTGRLIRLWIAEGFITSDNLQEGETLKDVARDYLDELIQRCVVQRARINYEGKVRSIRIHDLVRDLCIKKAKEQDFLEIFTSQSSNPNAREAELRRTAIYSMDKTYIPLPTQSRHLRSLVYETSYQFEDNQRPSLHDICQNFWLLRVLILEDINTSDGRLPTGIGSLIHLRYLGLRGTNIFHLPSTIGNLRNLLTLDYLWSNRISEGAFRIPNSFWEIEGLRHLHLPNISSIKGRVKLSALKHLETLRGIGAGSWMLEELPHLSPTVQKLSIEGITSEEQLEAVFRCPSIMSDTLYSLHLNCNISMNLQPIIHCRRLRKLTLWGRIKGGLSCCNQIPAGISQLVLGDTRFEEEAELAALGKLPNLKVLELYPSSYTGTKWTWTAGQFLQLKVLRLYALPNLEEWSVETGAMPQLTRLAVLDCRKLIKRLPEGLKFISTLQVLLISEEGDELKKRIEGGGEDGGGGEDAHIIQHVPHVEIFHNTG